MRFLVLAVVLAFVLVWTAAGCGGDDDDESIELPTAAQESGAASTATAEPTPTEPRRDTVVVELFTGKKVRISLVCSFSHHIGSKKKDAVAAARRLPPLKQRLLNRRRDYNSFLRRHPEQELPASVYERYRAVEAVYKSALTAYNKQIGVFNRLADSYNAALIACRT